MEYCNLWRNYGDIEDSWDDVKDIAKWFADNQEYLSKFAGPGHWNDPDMLIIGDFGLSLEQSKSQMTIWSLLAAPLIMSVDLRTIEQEFRNILLNKHAISINQDPLGIPGRLLSEKNKIHVWTKPISSKNHSLNSLAVGFVSYRIDGYIYIHKFYLSDFGLDKSTKYKITYLLRVIFKSSSTLLILKLIIWEQWSERPGSLQCILVSFKGTVVKILSNRVLEIPRVCD
ncbi:hypothetical protein NQ314_018728 [Rhamnusium bicolor]|uniref:Alpha-galactosidase n=1 Tax=Rhamnusium bicolor TaxID=1586634 RepID=A0AAV8WPG9_9CUCU|nr:hypothetical protein NQ314_018728 [Rhamnusium bicolor]